MEPSLRAGDWLLVDPLGFANRAPQAGELVVADDPRQPGRWLIKRVHSVTPDGALVVGGDHPAHVRDEIPPIEPAAVVGRPWLRYWPLRRIGRVGMTNDQR